MQMSLSSSSASPSVSAAGPHLPCRGGLLEFSLSHRAVSPSFTANICSEDESLQLPFSASASFINTAEGISASRRIQEKTESEHVLAEHVCSAGAPKNQVQLDQTRGLSASPPMEASSSGPNFNHKNMCDEPTAEGWAVT